MSARKAASAAAFDPVTIQGRKACLALSSDSVVFHKSGLEFRSATPFSPWTEMTLTMQSPRDHSRLHCNGVVISCTGNRHAGYHVSIVFTSMSKHTEEQFSSLAAHV